MKAAICFEFTENQRVKSYKHRYGVFNAALELSDSSRITVKVGGGAADVTAEVLEEFYELTDAVYVHGPQVPAYIHSKSNMSVGGSKGSICGNTL